MEEKTREGRTRCMSKDVVGCVQSLLEKKKFVFQFEDWQKIEMIVCEKEEVGKEADKTISDLPKRGQGELLTINWDPICEGNITFGKLINLYIFYCLCLSRKYQ